MKKIITVAFLSGLLPLVASAQYGASSGKQIGPETPGAPTAETVTSSATPVDITDTATAPPTCKKPIAPSSVRQADDTSEFNQKFSTYQDCIKAYVNAQNKLANLHVAAANKAVEDANAYVVETNAKLSGK